MKWWILLIAILGFITGSKEGVTVGLLGGMIFTGWLWFNFVNSRIKKNQEGDYEEVVIRRKKKK